MTFTDDDLKRLKEDIKTIDDFNGMRMFSDTLIPLLARLEAAEKIVQDKIDRGWGDHPLVKVWCKVAGKS